MKVTVKLFAAARDVAGADELVVDVTDGSTVEELRNALAKSSPELAPLVGRSMFAVDASYAKDGDTIPAAAEVACIPPVSGG